MANVPSTEACSALIEYWAKEYNRLFSGSSSESELTKVQQIPPTEMKQYIDNYKKWYETPVSQEDTKVKLSFLKRISEAWQLNVDTINKLIRYLESTLAVLAVMLIFGCRSGLYKISTSEDGKKIDESVQYYRVEPSSAANFIKDNGASPDGILYDEERMPIEISEGRSHREPDKPGWSGVLWMFSLGIFPMCQNEYMAQEITVKSPIGEKTGMYRVDAKRWSGWIPLFVGYPSSADERDADAKLPNQRLEGIGKERLVKNLVGEFYYKDYVTFAKKENAIRKSELKRIAESESKINELVAKNQYDEAKKLWDTDFGKRVGSFDSDTETWNRLKQLIADKREDFRVSNKMTDLEKKFSESKFEDVVAECEMENGGEKRHASIWAELKSNAKKAISERDRKIELARIGKRKTEISKLLNEKRYADVIAECDKETGANAGSRPEDANIWKKLSVTAKLAKYKIDRDAELSRIGQKVKQIEKWFEGKKYDAIIEACNKEDGKNPGAQPGDMNQWKKYRSKALGLRLLQKAASSDKTTLNIKGFSLGMSMEEVEILIGYYFPSMSYVRNGNQIKVAGHSMAFCQTENDRVIMLSFNREMLEKLLNYDAQTLRGWATSFAREYGMDFNGTSVHDRTSRGGASISVSQGCYVNRDRKKGLIVSIFGEQDVSDYNEDPEEIIREAESDVRQMMFSGFGNDQTAFDLGYRAARKADNVKRVRKWLKEEYVNGKGAEEGTLRVERMNE